MSENNDMLDSNNENAVVAELAWRAAQAPEVIDVEGHPMVWVHDGMTRADLSEYLPAPRTLKQTVTLLTPQSFTGYVKLFGEQARSIIFANPKAATFQAVLDYHTDPATPSWNTHRALCALVKTVAWTEWAALNKKVCTQAEFATFLEDHIPDIASPAGATLVELARNFEAAKDVTFQSSQRASDGSITFAYNETVKENVRGATMKVPAEFVLGLAPFEGSPKYQVTARLRYRIADGGKLTLWYDLLRVQDVLDAAFNDVLADVVKATAPAVRGVLLGAL